MQFRPAPQSPTPLSPVANAVPTISTNQPRIPSGPDSTSLRSTSTGLTLRTSRSGGRQNSRVVSRPVPSPASADCQGKFKMTCVGSRFPKAKGSAAITPTPAATPSTPPASPRPSVCSRKIRSKSPDPAPTAFRIASMSIRCSRWACIAMATPIAPSTIATRQIRLRIAVALSRPRRQRRIAFAKIHHLRIGQRRLQLPAHCRGLCIGGKTARGFLRQLHQQPLAHAAPGRHQSGAGQSGLRDHHARPQACAGCDPVGFLFQHR